MENKLKKAVFVFFLLAILAAIGTVVLLLLSNQKEIHFNDNLHLDFGNFPKNEKVLLNGKEYSAVLLKEKKLEDARLECRKMSGTLAWNRVTSFSGSSLKSYWVDIQNQTDLDDENLRDCFDEVRLPDLIFLLIY